MGANEGVALTKTHHGSPASQKVAREVRVDT